MIQGNLIVGQSGGPTAAINASLAGVFQAAKEAGIQTIYGMCNGIEGLLKESYVDLRECLTSDLDIELLKRTPSSFLGSCRFKLPDANKDEALYQSLFAILEKLKIKYFIYIGGNDSMDTIMQLSAYAAKIQSDIRFLGVPKTIDNDLAQTDHTPGYGSAAKFVASTMKELICDSDVYDMEAVTIVEIMGRNAGWLTAAAALSQGEDCHGADLIYLPERTFDTDAFLAKVDELRKSQKTVMVAVSEGIKNKNGDYVFEEDTKGSNAVDAFGHKMLDGVASYLADKVKKTLGIKARGITLNTTQRCASHLAALTDICEAEQAGAKAVNAALLGHSGEMVIFRRESNAPYRLVAETYDINQIANMVKEVPKEWITPDGTGVTEDFLAYARPLIQGELTPIMVNGLPRHLSLK